MIEYVKVCPRCGTENDETSTVCKGNECNHYIETIEATPRQPVEPQEPDHPGPANPLETHPGGAPNVREVKICPKCKAQNPKNLLLCCTKGCDTNIAFVEETAVPITHPKAPETVESRVYLENCELAGPIEIRAGQVIGQAHPTSIAQVQLSGISNIQFVSRSHCCFELSGGQWFVTAIPAATNATYVNGKLVAKGSQVAIRNGDLLTLANVSFRVRIMS